jgi:uncharacterized membrane protein YphA (DoxX/SURF4 family)
MLSLNRIKRMKQRMQPYIKSTQKKAPKKDKEKLAQFLEEFRLIKKKTTIVLIGIIIAYILLYISIISVVFGSLIIIQVLHQVVSILGTTIIILILGILHWYIGVLRSDAHTVVSEIISLGSRYLK